MWTEYDTDKPSQQWVHDDGTTIAKNNDDRYEAFKAKLDSGEIVPVKWEDTDEYKDAIAKSATAEKIAKIHELEASALRSLIAYTLDPSNNTERGYLQAKKTEIELLRDGL